MSLLRRYGAFAAAAVAAAGCAQVLGFEDHRVDDSGAGRTSGGRGGSAGAPAGGTSGGGKAGAGGSAGSSVSPEGGAGQGGSDDGGASGTGGSTGGSGGSGARAGRGGNSGDAGESGSPGSGGTGGSSGGSAGSASGAAGGGMAGSAGSGVVDFFGASRCTEDFDLCEDFEGGTLDAAIWSTETSGVGQAYVMLDPTTFARGSNSLHVHVENNNYARIRQAETFGPGVDHFFARMFVRFGSLPLAPQFATWTVSAALPMVPGDSSQLRVNGQFDGSKSLFGIASDLGPTGDWMLVDQDFGPEAIALNEWICLEWMSDSTDNHSRVWIDDVEHPSLATSSEIVRNGATWDVPLFASAWFGWQLYQSTSVTVDLWIDEIVVDNERIGCAN